MNILVYQQPNYCKCFPVVVSHPRHIPVFLYVNVCRPIYSLCFVESGHQRLSNPSADSLDGQQTRLSADRSANI